MKYYQFLLVLIYSLLVFSGVIMFELWWQVEYLYYSNINIRDMLHYNQLLEGHNTRYVLVYPVYWLSSVTGLERHYLFSIVIMLLIFTTSKLTSLTLVRLGNISESSARVLSLLFFGSLSLVMNGRIVFAVLAMSWFIWLFVCWYSGVRLKARTVLLSCVSILWLSSVSSGTFSVIYVAIVTWLAWVAVRVASNLFLSLRDLRISIVLVVCLLISSPLFFSYLDKNMSYYNYSMQAMLEHGVGNIFFFDGLASVIILLSIISFACLLYFGVFLYFRSQKPVLILLAIGLFGGLFGYSTLVMSVPPLFIITISMLSRYVTSPRYGKQREDVVMNYNSY